jgi:Trk-type K+ transport system membrane component
MSSLTTKQLSHFSPGRIILYSVFFTIILGTIALALPIARTKPIAFIDLLFTAASSACVTGSYTVELQDFTTFGHIVLLILMQIGGIGLITLTIFLLSFFIDFGFAHQVMVGQLLELESWKNVRTLIIFIMISTILIETLGAIAVYPVIRSLYPENAFFLSIFHAISSFCNVGVSLFPDSLDLFRNSYTVLFITALLMIVGGLGFVTWREILYYIRAFYYKKRYKFSLHSKIVLYGTFGIISTASLMFWILEHDNTYAHMGYFQSILNAIFQAVSFRSGGFTTVPVSLLALPTLFITLFIMFIGASPVSTGSGIKVTTVTVFLATIKAAISDRTSVEIRGRQIATDQVYKAISIIALSAGWICLTTLFLLITETGWGFFAILFEAVSAFSNVGISTGLTRSLTTIGKIFIILSMIIGRVGSLTLLLALRQLALKNVTESAGFTYPEERVMLG